MAGGASVEVGWRVAVRVVLILIGVALLGCRDRSKDSAGGSLSLATTSTSKSSVTDAPREGAVIDFLGPAAASAQATVVEPNGTLPPSAGAEDCTFGHRGVLLDLGDASMRARMTGARLTVPDLDVREHEGASWVAVRTRSLDLTFVSATESEPGIVVEGRVRGGAAKSASIYLNGKTVGSWSLTKGETTVITARAPALSIAKGTNELMLRFNGGGRATHDQLAEIDWIRVGPNDGDAPYSAPTRSDVITTVSAFGHPRRAISLRAPGFARCSAFIPNGSIVEGFLGVTGGEAEAEVRVLVDRAEPRIVGSFHLGGPTAPTGWLPIALPLGDVGTIAAVELVAKSSSKGARVAFAEARVVAPLEAKVERPAKTPTRGVILVVMGSTSRRSLALYGGAMAMPELGNLASGGVVFDAHRATSSFASGALGSMLTGLSPREHGAADADTALSTSVSTVAEAARQAGVVTAMFTANPTTTTSFGFGRGWETFVPRLPGLEEAAATAVFDDVGRWLDLHKEDRFFIVVHARGGHPPWDVTSEELKELPPANYAGSLEPKHAGEALAKARKAGGGKVFADPDRERAFALHGKALAAHDAALGALVARVRAMGREKDTVWIVTGDVGIDAAAHVPFLEEDALDESTLAVPLLIRGLDTTAGQRVSTATSGVDVAPTILEALALPPPRHLGGRSLFGIAAQKKTGVEQPLIAATTTRFSARWGNFAVLGAREREGRICNLALDADCLTDVRPSHPIAAEALHALAWTELVAKRPKSPLAPVSATSAFHALSAPEEGAVRTAPQRDAGPPVGAVSGMRAGSSKEDAGATPPNPEAEQAAALRAWGR